MTKVFVYDHVRTPRGRGKKDGALHEVPPSGLAAKVSRRARSHRADTSTVTHVIMGLRSTRSWMRGAVSRKPQLRGGLFDACAADADLRFLRLRLDAVNFGAAKMPRRDDIVIAGAWRSMSRVGLAFGGATGHGPLGQPARLLHAAGRFRRPDRHEIPVSRATTSTPMRWKARSAPPNAWEKGYFKKLGRPVKDQNGLGILDRDEHMPGTDMQALAR